ncbi:hypothetical protein AVEN_188413-1 [Araneus ventricosus]|uniref:Reverse transcriptase/retrotransposon-derived protein RNase H-like domain-containing protein n=1 Tax=Araneus ventricosus TaxID=182803 RepID=A0A4Y2RU47_ARAVE|nr:hypothetical protein AVEN_188413-1 [Araneus ventricosus]
MIFDQGKETTVTTDASSYGLGATQICQQQADGRRSLMAYEYRTLTPAKNRYAQIEKEALAVTCLQKEPKAPDSPPRFHPEPKPEDDSDVTGYQHSPAGTDPRMSLTLMSSPQSPKTYPEKSWLITEHLHSPM